MMIKKMLREPLLHLILMGGALFWVYDLINPSMNEQNQHIIAQAEVDKFLLQAMADSDQEISAEKKAQLVKAFISNELLFQEAKRLGLDHDAFIKERLIQKARFYLEGQFVEPDIDEMLLRQFYQENLSAYKKPTTVSFEHKVLNAAGVSQINRLLESHLPEEEFLARLSPFQKRTLLSPYFNNANHNGLVKVFGAEFAEEIFEQPLNQWAGLLESEEGFHIVKLTSLDEAGVSEFDEVKDKVQEDWISQQRALWVEQHVMLLWEKYEISADEFLPNA